jgi:hypothetical protein
MTRIARTARTLLAAATLLAPIAVLTLGRPSLAQQTFRTVNGQVTDKGGVPIKGAVVHLKDTKSLSQRSYITTEDGQYKFAQVSASTDFEIWADNSGSKSDSKSLSSFDNKSGVTINLKLQ